MSVGNYRKDIDGLRAIAVVAVILFHINPSILPGGFIGVDIFFVISGYLISKQIYKALDQGQFSIGEFYRRRIRRIAPAVITLILVVTVLSQLMMVPRDAELVAESGLWSVLSMANFYFWLFADGSYFAASSEELPLLHLWSLGVEEQFYFIWPMLVLLTYSKFRSKFFTSFLCLLIVLSFGVGHYSYYIDQGFSYYTLPSRAGELLVGAFIARMEILKQLSNLASEKGGLVSFVGLMLILASLIIIDDTVVFPGFTALIPVLGSALVLASGGAKTYIYSLLSNRVMRFLGVTSYSSYLWHWPILAFFRYGNFEIDAGLGFFSFSVSIFMGWLSYKFIETPFRKTTYSWNKVLVTYGIIPTAIVATIMLSFMKMDGYGIDYFNDEYKSSISAHKLMYREPWEYDGVCQKWKFTSADFQDDSCIVLMSDAAATSPILLWGDSNAIHYLGVFSSILSGLNLNLKNIGISGCPPLFTDPIKYVSTIHYHDCVKSLELVKNNINPYKIVIISASWSTYINRNTGFMASFERTLQEILIEVFWST